MKLGLLNIEKAYFGYRELSQDNAFLGNLQLIDGCKFDIDLDSATSNLYFESTGNSVIGLNKISNNQQIYYTTDTINWDWEPLTTGVTINLEDGDRVYLIGGLCSDVQAEHDSKYTNFSISGNVSIHGNLLYIWNASDDNEIELKKYCGYKLFLGCTGLTDASDLQLGTTATTLSEYCFSYMFMGCSNLVGAPELPATTLTQSCYMLMFCNCSSLTVAPELNATELAGWCYGRMFAGCTSLTYLKVSFEEWNDDEYYTYYWVDGINTLGRFDCPVSLEISRGVNRVPFCWNVNEPASISNYVTFTAGQNNSTIGIGRKMQKHYLWYSTDSGMTWDKLDTSVTVSLQNSGDSVFVAGMLYQDGKTRDSSSYDNGQYTRFTMSGRILLSGNGDSLWRSQDMSAPLRKCCGLYMFDDCVSLVNIDEFSLPATVLSNQCYQGMFIGCTSLQSVPEDLLPAISTTYMCYNSMFQSCTSLIHAPKLPAVSLGNYCYAYMFRGCTSLQRAPELLADNIGSVSYNSMFLQCSRLNYIKCLATSGFSNCKGWVSGVQTSSGTFIKHPNATGWSTGVDGIPSGWTVVDYVPEETIS